MIKLSSVLPTRWNCTYKPCQVLRSLSLVFERPSRCAPKLYIVEGHAHNKSTRHGVRNGSHGMIHCESFDRPREDPYIVHNLGSPMDTRMVNRSLHEFHLYSPCRTFPAMFLWLHPVGRSLQCSYGYTLSDVSCVIPMATPCFYIPCDVPLATPCRTFHAMFLWLHPVGRSL